MFFIAGYHGSGKTSVAEFMVDYYDYSHVERSSVLDAAKLQDGVEMPMNLWREDKMKCLGRFALEDIMVDSALARYPSHDNADAPSQGLVITGNRSIEEIKYIAGRLVDVDPSPPKILSIIVDETLLFKRFVKRARTDADKNISIDNFSNMLRREKSAGIETIFRNSDYTVNNNGSTTGLFDSISRILSL